MTCVNEKGHCWHRADGTPFQRNAELPQGLVDVACCHCATAASMQAFAPHVAPKTAPRYVPAEHGPHHPLFPEDA